MSAIWGRLGEARRGSLANRRRFARGGGAMRNKLWAVVAILLLVLAGNSVRAAELRAEMEAANKDFLTAFNAPNPAAFLAQYTPDAVLIFNGGPPITGPEAIKEFWESRIN